MGTILIDKLLHTVVKRKASDLHIAVGQPPVLRMDGHMKRLETKVLEPEDTVALMKSIAPERSQKELQEKGGADFGFAFGDLARFRVSIFKQKGCVGMVLRQIPNKLLSFDDLGTPPALKDLCHTAPRPAAGHRAHRFGQDDHARGGDRLPEQTCHHHIITIEDPIEFYHPHKKCTVNQREIGVDVPTFAEAIRRALRQDPDIILVGEMRDLETIEAAITAAETGHIVFGTLHTTGARDGQPHHRRVPHEPAGADPHPVVHVDHRHPFAGPVAQDRRRPRGGLRNARRHARHRQPDPRKQDLPHHLLDPDRAEKGMQLLDDHMFKLWQTGIVEKKECFSGPTMSTT